MCHSSLDARGRIRLSHQSLWDLDIWKNLAAQELQGRPMVSIEPKAALHSDAADMGFEGTLNDPSLCAGVDGHWRAQEIWNWKDRAESISYRELKAIRKLLQGNLGTEIAKRGHENLLLHVDNQAVVHITNSFVSASRPMMRELRKLKLELDHMGLKIKAEWIPSGANKFADGILRRFPRGDLQIKMQ